MNKSISISNPSNVQSLVVRPYGSGDKIGGKLNLKIFSSATYIDVSDLDVEELGELPSSLVTFNGSNNKITNISDGFSVPDSITNFNLQKNSLTKLDINRILDEFIDIGDVTTINPDPIIDISKLGNAVPDSDGLTKIGTLQTNGWNVKYNKGEYVLSSDATSVSEGGPNLTINIDRTTSSIADGEVIPFAISGIQADDFTSTGFDGVAAPTNLQGSFTLANNTDSATFSLATDVGISKYLEGESLTMKIFQLTNITSESSPPLPDGTYNITVQGKPITLDIASGSATNDISALQIYVPEETSTVAVPLASGGVSRLDTLVNSGDGYSTATGVTTTTDGSGTNLTVDINSLYGNDLKGIRPDGVTINNPGTGYLPYDTITITNPLGVGAVINGNTLTTTTPPSSPASWYMFGSGYTTDTNVPVIYDSANPSSTQSPPYTGNGVDFTVDVTTNSFGNVIKLEINNRGSGYLKGDQLLVDAGNKDAAIRLQQVSENATTTVLETLGDVNLTLTGTVVDEISIPVVDTTIVPYQLTSVTSTTEGNVVLITLKGTVGTTVPDGTTVDYTISGIQANDIAQDLTGAFTFTSTITEPILSITVLADADANENETLTLTLDDYPTVNTSIRLFDS